MDQLRAIAELHHVKAWIEDGRLFVVEEFFYAPAEVHEVRTKDELLHILGY